MNKLSQAVVEESSSETVQDATIDSENLYLIKKKKEDEIRTKLDEFARELSRAQRQRDQH